MADSDFCIDSKTTLVKHEETLMEQQESSSSSQQESSFSTGDGEQSLKYPNQQLAFEEKLQMIDLGSASEKIDASCELGSEPFECEKNTLDSGVKVKDFDDQVGKTGNFVSGFDSDVAKEKKLDVGISPVEKPDKDDLLEAKKKQLLEQIERFERNPGMILGLKGIDESIRHEMVIEVIDGVAVIEPALLSKNGNDGAKVSERKHEKHEADGKKPKGSRKKRKDIIKTLEINAAQKETGHDKEVRVEVVPNLGRNRVDQLKYSREEMEALRFVNVVEQRKMWRQVCTYLGDVVLKEYNDLARSAHFKNNGVNFDPRPSFARKADSPGILGEISCENMDTELENLEEMTVNMKLLDLDDSHKTGAQETYVGWEDEYIEDEDSDEEYASIQKLAFVVEGEPDFDSGPPEDGWEYLRRVRWEAKHIPKVKVAKLDSGKLIKEQSVYMPQIPEIEKCPEHFLPLKQWEDEFLAYFSYLRQSLTSDEGSTLVISKEQQSTAGGVQEIISLLEHAFSSVSGTLNSDESQSYNTLDDSSIKNVDKESSITCSEDSEMLKSTQKPVANAVGGHPTASEILAMNSVTRVSRLRKHISLVETSDSLSKRDCLWMFALCATVDTPLHADTCAALRSLLRKCCGLRARKVEMDDETIMLNILITIAGKYFGQSEG